MTAYRLLDWVLDDLAIGAAFPRAQMGALAERHGLGAVIDLRLEDRDEAEELARRDIGFLHLPTGDLCAVSQEMLDQGVAFARSAQGRGRKLLVHCQHGIGRAPLLALCILVDRGHAPLEALSAAKDARESVSPSPRQYEAWAAWLRRRRPDQPVPGFETFAAIAYRHLPRQG